ncbi:MAG: hypothetical protein K1X56_13380, partial [Flavobacteriales bacterium]|nr:hypothetical protein [Flavobacteriales bacterium]
MEFTISNRAKNFSFALIGVGLVGTIAGFFMDHSEHHQQFWANLLVNGFFFFAIAIAALFMLALQYATESAWGVVTKRVYEAV